jgi:N-6 DNA Methylase
MQRRRAPGAVDTPPSIARHLAEAGLAGRRSPRTVCDPAAGDGRLLAAVAAACVGDPTFFAADVDATPWREGGFGNRPGVHFEHSDALGRGGAQLWSNYPVEGVDLVVGNPPFLNQLYSVSKRTPDQRRRVALLGRGVPALADTATAFLVQACGMLAPGGRVAMIMPLSFLASRDAGAARRKVLETCCLSGIWVSDGSVFPDADVETCAVVLERVVESSTEVRRWHGADWEAIGSRTVAHADLLHAPTWSHLVSDVLGDVPEVHLSTAHGRLGDLASATAGFRDQFYGMAPLVRGGDGPVGGRTDDLAPVITSGAIEPGALRWSDAPARIAGRSHLRPVIDPAEIASASLARWIAARRVPKVLVATQTRVVEAACDPTGEWVPSTPVVSVECRPADLWRVLAVLLAPPVTVWARQRYAGAARSARSVKLSARQVLEVPLPADAALWADGAEEWRNAHDLSTGGADRETLMRVGSLMCEAYGCGDAEWEWWLDQLPRRR